MENRLIDVLRRHRGEFATVVPYVKGTTRIIQLNFTAANHSLTPEILADTTRFSAYVSKKLSAADATYGVGGYGEHRTIYQSSDLFDGANGEEPRRLHLGLDIWGRPRVAVRAPLDGIVHSFAFNDGKGNYGATIILSHHLEGLSFHTLYGHLSLSSIGNIHEGDRIGRGDVFAEFGVPFENGHWPPHLHLQVIEDIGDWKGDYPGVCRYTERERWMTNSVDPALLAGLETLDA